MRHGWSNEAQTLLSAILRVPTSSLTAVSQEEGEFYKHPAMRRCMDGVVPVDLTASHPARSKDIITELSGLLHSTLLSDVASLRIELGRLVGTTTSRTVALPILSETLLSNEDPSVRSGATTFIPAIESSQEPVLLASMLRAFAERNNTEQKVELDASTATWSVRRAEDGYTQVDITSTDDVTHTETYVVKPLASHVLIIPNLTYQLRIITESKAETDADPRDDQHMHESQLKIQTFLFNDQHPQTRHRDGDGRHGDGDGRHGDGDGRDEEESLMMNFMRPQWKIEMTQAMDVETLDDAGLQVHISFTEEFWAQLKAKQPDTRALKQYSTLLLQNAKLLAGFCDAPANAVPGLYYPSLFGDSVAEVRRHYNLKKIGVAAESAIEIVRRTNNQAKRLLIQEAIPRGSSVLDLACGHGQDLLKLSEKDLRLYVGIDLSAEEIREARSRIARGRRGGRFSVPQRCRFHVGNLLAPSTYSKFLTGEAETFDVVMVQLAIHYALESENAAELVLSSISERLKVGGLFIGSLPSSFVIHDRMQSSLQREVLSESEVNYTFGNSVYSVTFDGKVMTDIRGGEDTDIENMILSEIASQRIRLPGDPTLPFHPWIEKQQSLLMAASSPNAPPSSQINVPMGFGEAGDHEMNDSINQSPLLFELSERWGLSYTFWLVDHIDAAEYIVPWRAFCRLALRFGLQCVLTSGFRQYCQGMVERKHPDAVDFEGRIEMLKRNSSTVEEQEQVISFYQVFAFRKIA